MQDGDAETVARPVHIIDHDGSYFRLIVKNGLSKVDNTFWIGEEPKQVRSYFYYRRIFSSTCLGVLVLVFSGMRTAAAKVAS